MPSSPPVTEWRRPEILSTRLDNRLTNVVKNSWIGSDPGAGPRGDLAGLLAKAGEGRCKEEAGDPSGGQLWCAVLRRGRGGIATSGQVKRLNQGLRIPCNDHRTTGHDSLRLVCGYNRLFDNGVIGCP